MINILVAHDAEGRPFRDHYGLDETRQGELTLFCNASVRLLVTGEGAERVGQSLSALWRTLVQPQRDQWLNFGVAGSRELGVGTLVIAGRVHSAETAVDAVGEQDSVTTMRFNLPVVSCLSVAALSRHYPQHGIVDMEAATITGFLDINNALDQVTVLKLVSDCPGKPPSDRGALRALISSAASGVCEVSDMILVRQHIES